MSNIPVRLVLASGSPRRQSLLAEAGYAFEVIAPRDEVECGVCSTGGPAELVCELAVRKAADVAQQLERRGDGQRRVLLAADTVAECQGQVLGKPADEDHARAMLELLRGREHRVLTGVCVLPLPGDSALARHPPHVEAVVTRLAMDTLSDEEIDDYLASGGWRGKAGGFGYQDRLGWVHVVEGSETNVVGLPIERIAELLAPLGPFTRAGR